MITRNAIVISVSIVLLLVSVALVLVSREAVGPNGDISQSSKSFTEEEGFEPQLCNFAPTGDYMLCCKNAEGEEIDCTEKTHFEANEKVTIIVNQNLLQNEQTPYTLCASSDLLLSPGVFSENSENGDESECVDIGPQMENFVIRKDAFVPSEYPADELTLLQLSTVQDGSLDSSELLLKITRLLAR